MKSILIVHHGRGVGGGLIALIGLINELKSNYRVEVLCIFESIALQYIKETGVNVFLPKSKFYKRYYKLFIHSDASYSNIIKYLLDFEKILLFFLSKFYFARKELKIVTTYNNIVYLNSTFISDWAYAAKKIDKKVIIHVREPLTSRLFDIKKFIIRNTIKNNCDKIIAISQDNADRLNLSLKTTVIYDPLVLNGRDKPNKIKLQNKSHKYFLYVGGMSQIKGVEQLIKSLDHLNEDIKIFFLGGEQPIPKTRIEYFFRLCFDSFFRNQKHLLNKIKTSKNIVYIGLTENVFYYLANSIALISPFSKPHASLPILEAFSIGKPVIVSNIKGMDELVSQTTGMFFKNNNPSSLAHQINKMSLMPELEYNRMCASCKNKFLQIYKGNQTVQSVIENIKLDSM